MKTVVEPQLQDAALATWRGAQAKIWMFHVTHNKLALILFRRDEPEVLYIVANGCEHMVGPFAWRQANITITETLREADDTKCHILDEAVGFNLCCSSATLVRAPATDFDTTFEGFLGDTTID